MTTETKRDLAADLAICEAAAPAYIIHSAVYSVPTGGTNIVAEVCRDDYEPLTEGDTEFILEAREAWPHAIRRAIAAEAESERCKHSYRLLLACYDGQSARAAEYYSEAIRLRDELKAESLRSAGWEGEAQGYAKENERLKGALSSLLAAIDRGDLVRLKLSSGMDHVIRLAREALKDETEN
ncbi:hypothetical protein [Paenibacillus sp. SN-8-1]|uniref:hypothetical protein n=1 Tax=Paenibacillus sp. SN-8-1 TaxID=3435409 RepID=UPI003D9A0CB2